MTTETTKHTPGPWTLHPRVKLDPPEGRSVSWKRPPVVYRGGTIVCTVNTSSPDLGEREANARLIAASPELLEACKLALDQVPEAWKNLKATHGVENRQIAELRALIAKAEGRE